MEVLSNAKNNDNLKHTYLQGRQRQVIELLSFFQSSQLVGLFGENGTGKSSFVKNGLIPELNRGFLGMAGRNWKTSIIRPGISPLENLAGGIAELIRDKDKFKPEEEYLLTKSLKTNNEALRRASLNYLKNDLGFNSLLIIDNFEDLFHFKNVGNNPLDWENIVTSFIQNITKCALNSDSPLYFLIILRSDFVTNIFKYRNFHEVISKSQYSLPQFRKSEFQEVVVSQTIQNKISINHETIDLLYQQIGRDLKNLKLLNLFLEKAAPIAEKSIKKEIDFEIFQQVDFSKLYEDKLESFYTRSTQGEQKILEKLFKQITVGEEGTSLRKPIQIGQLLRVIGIEFTELNPLLSKLKEELHFALEIVKPSNDRLDSEDAAFIPENSAINVKNEQFIPHWPRLIEWIRQEKESQEIYKRLSETAKMFDQELTGYLNPPDLDYSLKWYEETKPDELWANQFNPHFKKVIAYLLESKRKFQEKILEKEAIQKEKIKRIRKTAFYLILGTIFIILVIGVFAYDAKKQESIAQQARLKAESEKERARIEKERADFLYIEAQSAMKDAQKSEQIALIEKKRADDEYIKANTLQKKAESQKQQIQEAFKSLDSKSAELGKTVAELQVSNIQKERATKDAESARAYQESLNKILYLKNIIQKNELQKEQLEELLPEIENAYLTYQTASISFKGQVLPNNDLYQILIQLRKDLIGAKMLEGRTNDLAALPNGLREIAVSSTGFLAAGGDDGTLLYSKSALGNGKPEFRLTKIVNDRIRSLEFINSSDLMVGTVNGKIYEYKANTGQLNPIEIGTKSNAIVEQLIYTNAGIFALRGGEIVKIDLKNGYKVEKLFALKVSRIFKYDKDRLLISSQDSNLFLLDITTLQWRPVDTDFKKKQISSLITSGQELFVGMENGDVHGCNSIMFGSDIKIVTKLIIPAHQSRITSLAYDSSTQRLFTASLDQKATIFDLSLRKLGDNYLSNHLLRIEGFKKWIWDFELIQNGQDRDLLTVDENGAIKYWQTGSETIFNELFSK
jgi:WD40 repeat protein